MKKLLCCICVCLAAQALQAKEPKLRLNDRPLPAKHIIASSSLDSLVAVPKIHTVCCWASKEIVWKPLGDLVESKLRSQDLIDDLYFCVDNRICGRLSRIDKVQIDAAFVDAEVHAKVFPIGQHIRPKYRGRRMIEIRLLEHPQERLRERP